MFRFLSLFCILLLLSGCKESERAQGIWYGVAKGNGEENIETAVFISESGKTYISLRNGIYLNGQGYFEELDNSTLIKGIAQTNFESTDIFSVNNSANMIFSGELLESTGSIDIFLDNKSLYTVNLLRSNDAVATQDAYVGEWLINPEDPTSVDTWTISSQGLLQGKDALGCQYTGLLKTSEIINLADFTVIVEACSFEGIYMGVMSLFEDPQSDRIGIFFYYSNNDYIFVNGLEKIN